jgi:hypothetical protein
MGAVEAAGYLGIEKLFIDKIIRLARFIVQVQVSQ